jgi:hypothetical protein
MAEQNANAVAITGGTAIFTSVTTPSVTATTTDLTLNAISTGAIKFSTAGGLQAQVANTASAVNYLQLTGNATGGATTMSAQGSDGNIFMQFNSKGTSGFSFYSGSGTTRQLRIDGTSSGANFLGIAGSATGQVPILSIASQSSDTNVSMAFQPKGTGAIDLAAGSSGVNISNGGTVTAITRTAAGTSYTSAPTWSASAPTTAGGVTATGTTYLAMQTIPTITSGGTGYTVGDTLTFVGGSGITTATTLTVSTVSSGVITAVTIAANGAYATPPTSPISVTGGTGTGATFTTTAWGVASTIVIGNAGSGYIEQPTVTFSGGGCSGATAYATVGSGTTITTLASPLTLQTPALNANNTTFQVRDDATIGASQTTFYMIGASSGLGRGALRSNKAFYIASGSANSIVFLTNSSLVNEGSTQMAVSHTASAVNYVQVTGAVTGTATIPRAPILSAQGSDTNISLALLPKGIGIVYTNQNAPVAYDATNTLLIADILSQVITTTSATAVSLTLPTGTLTDAGILGGTGAVGTAFEWSIINLGSALGAITLVAGTAHTIVGSTAIAVGASARLKTRKTATNTYITYRLA